MYDETEPPHTAAAAAAATTPEQRQYMTTKIISEGAYGCALYPGIKCDNTPEGPDYLTKIQVDGPLLKNENEMGQTILNKYKNRHILFYAPILTSCNMVAGEIVNDEIQKCKVVQNSPETSYANSKIRYIGKMSLNGQIKKYQQQPTTATNKIIDHYMYLLKSIQMLLEIDIVHLDIKDNNIMYDQAHHVPILIDFGFSCKMPLDFNTSAQIFTPYESYLIRPIELFIISHISKKPESEILTSATIQELIDQCMTNIDHPEGIYKKIPVFDTTEIETYKTNIQTFLQTYTGYSYTNLHDKLMETYKTWDLYSLSTTFLFLIHMYFESLVPIQSYIPLFKSHILAIPADRDSIQSVESKIIEILPFTDT
jgi:tRNA A-37 threonylcarbamoyl transferase component Bud32